MSRAKCPRCGREVRVGKIAGRPSILAHGQSNGLPCPGSYTNPDVTRRIAR